MKRLSLFAVTLSAALMTSSLALAAPPRSLAVRTFAPRLQRLQRTQLVRPLRAMRAMRNSGLPQNYGAAVAAHNQQLVHQLGQQLVNGVIYGQVRSGADVASFWRNNLAYGPGYRAYNPSARRR